MTGIYVEEEILGNLDINSKFLIFGVVNSPWPFLGLIKGIWWLPKGFFNINFYFILVYKGESLTTLAEKINEDYMKITI